MKKKTNIEEQIKVQGAKFLLSSILIEVESSHMKTISWPRIEFNFEPKASLTINKRYTVNIYMNEDLFYSKIYLLLYSRIKASSFSRRGSFPLRYCCEFKRGYISPSYRSLGLFFSIYKKKNIDEKVYQIQKEKVNKLIET